MPGETDLSRKNRRCILNFEVIGDGRKASCGGDHTAVRWDEPKRTGRKDPQACERVACGQEVHTGDISRPRSGSLSYPSPRGGWALGIKPAACAIRSASLAVLPSSSPHSTTILRRFSPP